jgi:hypothetical protein
MPMKEKKRWWKDSRLGTFSRTLFQYQGYVKSDAMTKSRRRHHHRNESEMRNDAIF